MSLRQALIVWRSLFRLIEGTVCNVCLGSLLVTIRSFFLTPRFCVTGYSSTQLWWITLVCFISGEWVSRGSNPREVSDLVTRTSVLYLTTFTLSYLVLVASLCQDTMGYCMNNHEYIQVNFFRWNALFWSRSIMLFLETTFFHNEWGFPIFGLILWIRIWFAFYDTFFLLPQKKCVLFVLHMTADVFCTLNLALQLL